LQRLQTQLELLGGQTSSLIQGRRARTAAAAGAAGNLSMIEEKLVGRNLEVSFSLFRMTIVSSSESIFYFYFYL